MKYIYICVCIYICINIYISVSICIYIHIYIYKYIHINSTCGSSRAESRAVISPINRRRSVATSGFQTCHHQVSVAGCTSKTAEYRRPIIMKEGGWKELLIMYPPHIYMVGGRFPNLPPPSLGSRLHEQNGRIPQA